MLPAGGAESMSNAAFYSTTMGRGQTAGNSSGQNDGAVICIVTHPDHAMSLGLRPMARLVSWAVAGVAPATMGIGPVPASAAALGVPD